MAVTFLLDAGQGVEGVVHEFLTVRPEVHLLAAAQNHRGVEQGERVCGGGVDRRDDGDVVGVQSLDHGHDLVGGEGVQAARGLVQEENGRVGDERDGDVQALGLAAGDALDHLGADEDVPRGGESELFEELLARGFFGLGALLERPLELGGVHEHLVHGQRGDQGVELLDVAGVPAEKARGRSLAAEVDDAVDLADSLAAGDEVEERRLAGARRAEQRGHLARVEHAGDVVEEHRGLLLIAEALHSVGQISNGDANPFGVQEGQVGERAGNAHGIGGRGSRARGNLQLDVGCAHR